MTHALEHCPRRGVTDAELLGERQMNFLRDWATDWSGGAWMKVVLSQTLFANVATLPRASSKARVASSDSRYTPRWMLAFDSA